MLSPYTFTLFLPTRMVLVDVLVGKNQEKNGFFKNVSKKYINAIFSVLMDKVIYDKFKQIIIKVFTKWKYVCFIVTLWKIMFDLLLTMSVGILLRLGGAVKKKRLRKKKLLLKYPKTYPSWQKKVIVVAQLLSAQIGF